MWRLLRGEICGDVVVEIELIEVGVHLESLRIKFFKSVATRSAIIEIIKFIVFFGKIDLLFREVSVRGERVKERIRGLIVNLL